ncbi:unnamed protein product [Allacma fusca]|uniref:Uncharacterized protein n=1 Tax=Allacma fusca TaxID=39272 RepID=A0A8J2PXW2_9HEXA|nr:unnamed protein product [Allacma fusca]
MSETKQESSLHTRNYMIGMCMTFFSLFNIVVNVNFFRYRYEIPQFLSQYLIFGKQLKKYAKKQKQEKTRSADILEDQAGIFMFALYLPTHWFIPLAVIQTTIFMLYFSMWFTSIFCLAFPMFGYVFTFMEILDELELDRPRYTTMDYLRTPAEFMKIWRDLQVLNTNATNICSSIVLPANHWLFCILTIYCIYGVIKLHGGISVLMLLGATMTLMSLVVVYSALAKIHVRSRQVLISWNNKRQSLLTNKFLHSCVSMKIYVSSFYYIDHGMILTMLKIITESTVNLVVLN